MLGARKKYPTMTTMTAVKVREEDNSEAAGRTAAKEADGAKARRDCPRGLRSLHRAGWA